MENEYHVPALLIESIKGLSINPNGVYIDVTFGGGGHSIEILNNLDKGKLIAFDQDQDAEKNADIIAKQTKYKNKFIFYRSNFKYLKNFIQYSNIDKVDGILADLGVSSHQFNDAERGFSFRLGGIPDMRMNTKTKLSALDILNTYSHENLSAILKTFGEIKSSLKLSEAIIANRKIQSLNQLNEIVKDTLKTKKDFKILAMVYQALRIEVNNEIEALKALLKQSGEILKKNGRLVVISYHSLEDRTVKNYLKYGNFQGQAEHDIYGNQNRIFKELTKKAIVPNEDEIKQNNRIRSAKLRIGQKL
jgi:16S rRNA (cytosine1402-N4)-methyltransferase